MLRRIRHLLAGYAETFLQTSPESHYPMYFEARGLNLYSEPIKAIDLIEDAVYFAVNYMDKERSIPVLEPYTFSGRDLASGDSGRLYFRSLDPVRREIYPEPDPYSDFHIESEENAHFFEYDQALEELMVCSLRRQGFLDHLPEGTSTLWFDAREIQAFSTPVQGNALEEGSVYFSVFFVDEDFLIPGLEPYIFIGRDIDMGEPGLYFQDMRSYRRGVRHDSTTKSQLAIFVVDSDDNLNHFEYEQALEELMMCSLRRREAGCK